jgi:phage terminase large subunit
MPDLYRRLAADLTRDRESLVPPAFLDLWLVLTWHIWYGGRASAKSWSIARVLLMQGFEQPLRILCCRELQGSIRESAHKLLKDQIRALDLEDFYDVQADRIIGKNGTEFIFEGLRYNYSKVRSYEGVNRLWVEEAQSVSDRSWEELIPTVIRNAGIQCYISFNPMSADDPVWTEFVKNPRPNSCVRKVSYKDNPHISPELDAERKWLLATDPDAHDHIWEGNFRQVSEAQILRGKYVIEEFDINLEWAGPYHGLDYGFGSDPSASVRCHIDDETRTLYVSAEYWRLGAEIDALPGELENAIPGISRHVVYADSARPESTSFIQRNGIPNIRSVEKWPGSVDDGIAYLRAFSRIVIHSSCTHLKDECQRYQFKTDRLTGLPLPEVVDKHNHLIDSIRYALSPLIRNLPSGGYFTRSALLVKGEPVEPTGERPERVMVTLAICERPGTAVGVVYWSFSPFVGEFLRVLDYDLVEIDEALNADWLGRVFAHAQGLRAEWNATDPTTMLWMEEGDLYDAMAAVFGRYLAHHPEVLEGPHPSVDLVRLQSEDLPDGDLEMRAGELRATVNGGRFVKLSRTAYAHQVTHRSVSANHLVGQLLGYRPAAKDAAHELVSAFVLGCLISRGGDCREEPPPPQLTPVVPPPLAKPPAARVLLTPGRHVIDGVSVDVPPLPGNDLVWYEVPAGTHVIDDKITYVHPPSGGIQIML